MGASWDSDDADGCSGSGSIRVEVAPNLHLGTFVQCRKTNPGVKYTIGYKYKQSANANMLCSVNLFASGDCTTDPVVGGVTVQTAQVSVPLDWTNSTPRAVDTTSETRSIQVYCQLNNPGVGYFDQIYLNTVAGSF